MKTVTIIVSMSIVLFTSGLWAGQNPGRQAQEIYEQPDDQADNSAETRRQPTDSMSCTEASNRVKMNIFDLSQIVLMGPLKGVSNIPFKTASEGNDFYVLHTPCDQPATEVKEFFMLTALRGAALKLKKSPSHYVKMTAKGVKERCNKGAFIYHHIGNMKVDSYDACAAIIGCSSRIEDQSRQISYFISIKGKQDLISIERTWLDFDQANPPIRPDNPPEMPWLKICDEKSTLTETIMECEKRKLR